MDKAYLLLKRATLSRPSGQWSDDDFDVFVDGAVVGRIMKANAAPVGMAWMWTLAFGYHEDRTPTHGVCRDPRGRDEGVRKKLATGVKGPRAPRRSLNWINRKA
jgi:hypothetical protein